MLEIGKIYKFRSGARVVLGEPKVDLDGIIKVPIAYVSIGSTYALRSDLSKPVSHETIKDLTYKDWKYISVLNDPNKIPTTPTEWAHVKSATHELEIGETFTENLNDRTRTFATFKWKKLKK